MIVIATSAGAVAGKIIWYAGLGGLMLWLIRAGRRRDRAGKDGTTLLMLGVLVGVVLVASIFFASRNT